MDCISRDFKISDWVAKKLLLNQEIKKKKGGLHVSKLILGFLIIIFLAFLVNSAVDIKPLFELIGALFRLFVTIIIGMIKMIITIFEALL